MIIKADLREDGSLKLRLESFDRSLLKESLSDVDHSLPLATIMLSFRKL